MTALLPECSVFTPLFPDRIGGSPVSQIRFNRGELGGGARGIKAFKGRSPRRGNRDSSDNALGTIEEDIFSISRGWNDEYAHLEDEFSRQDSPLGNDKRRPVGRELPTERISRQMDKSEASLCDRTKGNSPQKRVGSVQDLGNARAVRIDPSGTPTTSTSPSRSTHRKLKVMAGALRGKRLLSPADQNVRPMMEVVRGAVFNMLQALAGSPACLPGGRWLDLYSGTGSVGIEALSRGCDSVHFVEMDPWVVSAVLSPNLDACNYSSRSLIHTLRVESLLERAETNGGSFLGGPFDYISVTPPYEAVSYTELMGLLARTPLVSATTCMVVEYPLLSRHELPEVCGPLTKIRDRKYGRTNVSVYGPDWAAAD